MGSNRGIDREDDDQAALPVEPTPLDTDPCAYCYRPRDDHAPECPLNPRKIGLDYETEEDVDQ